MRRTELNTLKQVLEKEIVSLRDKATDSISKSAQTKGLIGSLIAKNKDREALVAGIDRGIRQLEGELESTREEIETKRQGLESINRRLIALETTREVQGESGFGRAVEAILDAKITGVHGTIGQLGKVDDDYVIALETAIGPRLGHIVVDDDQIAQRCIQYLKQNQAGRADFCSPE